MKDTIAVKAVFFTGCILMGFSFACVKFIAGNTTKMKDIELNQKYFQEEQQETNEILRSQVNQLSPLLKKR